MCVYIYNANLQISILIGRWEFEGIHSCYHSYLYLVQKRSFLCRNILVFDTYVYLEKSLVQK